MARADQDLGLDQAGLADREGLDLLQVGRADLVSLPTLPEGKTIVSAETRRDNCK